MRLRVITGVLVPLSLIGCVGSLATDAPTAEERLVQRIEFELKRRGLPQSELSGLSLGQLKAISHILGDDENEGQKRGRIEAVLRRG